MDLEPQTQPVARVRGVRSRHGSTSKTSSCRPPSPDSACEHDSEWTGGATSGQEEMTSDLSEESSDTAHTNVSRKSGPSMRRKSDLGLVKGGQDSDVDSGIVAYGKPGQRIGSTSSADTDSSQESRRRIEYSPPLSKSELKARSASSTLRIHKHSSLTESSSGPIKGDHLALKECNRRPPTPLSVFPESHHCVRFDEQLQLSEQNIRRSCRKLFATLYAQRFSYPNRPNSNSLLQGRNGISSSVRVRSRTVPELELRRYSPISVDGRHGRSQRQSPVAGRRADTITWTNWNLQKSAADVNVLKKAPLSQQIQHFKSTYQYPMENESRATQNGNGALTENTVNGYKSATKCTCVTRQNSVPVSSSQSPSCTCRCCSCAPQPSRALGLYKSSSCSTLSSALSHQSRPQLTQFPQRNLKKSVAQTESADAKLQKTSSCSNLLDRNLQVSKVPVYSDNMVHAYAHIASVIPSEEAKTASQGGRRAAKALSKMKQQSTENIYDCIRSPSASLSSSKTDLFRTESGSDRVHSRDAFKGLENSRTSRNSYSGGSVSKMSCDSDRKSVSSDIYCQVGEVGNASVSSRQSLRERNHKMYSQRPKSVGVVVPSPVYLKSALKKPTLSALQNVNESAMGLPSTNVNGRLVEVEYAVVDKSKKNRYTSLPALNGSHGNATSIETDDKDHPPVPPKKMLHKSDFSLYRSRSSSPKKSLLERMSTLTRNAKSAIQKAFSTERIYRPEREERIEAGKSLQRSRSFIKGLAGSFRRKKRKSRNVMAEVANHGSSNSDWEDTPNGPNSPIHVRGQLLQLNLDGSQVVELTKPPSKPYGFFVARGRVRNSKGVFVSRMRDQETQKQLAGLLDIGDEILEIDGMNVKNADIMEVNSLMSNKNTLLLTVLPYICRKDT